jgi:hypothetical protein
MVPVVSSPLRAREYSLGILKLPRPNPSKDAPANQSSRNLLHRLQSLYQGVWTRFHFSGKRVNQAPTVESDVDSNSERRKYQGPCHPFPVKEWGWASMSRLARLTSEFLKKMENNATTEANRLRKSNHGKLRLIGTTIGIIVVILVAIWMARP